MKIETRNQLLALIIGTAIALGISLLPGFSGQARMLIMFVCIIVIFRVFKLPIVVKLFTRKPKDDDQNSGSTGQNRS